MSVRVIDAETAEAALKIGVRVDDIYYDLHDVSFDESMRGDNPVQECVKAMEQFNGNCKVSVMFANFTGIVGIPIRLSVLRKYANLQPNRVMEIRATHRDDKEEVIYKSCYKDKAEDVMRSLQNICNIEENGIVQLSMHVSDTNACPWTWTPEWAKEILYPGIERTQNEHRSC